MMRSYERRARRVAVAMVLVAFCCRILGTGIAFAWDFTQEDLAAGLLFLEMGQVGSWEVKTQDFGFQDVVIEREETANLPPFSLEIQEEAEEIEVTQAELEFSQGVADLVEVNGAGLYSGSILERMNRDLDLEFGGTEPVVLIVHSHTSESYAQAVGWEYLETDTARTQDASHNVVRVGDAVAEVLEEAGFGVLHDTSIHDFPNYNLSYANALTTIQGYLEKYPSIQMVLDIHRDAAEDENGLPISHIATDGTGENFAQLMLVVGTDQGGLEHPNWEENFAWALQLQGVFLEKFPQIARPVNLRVERFNMHTAPASILVEVGSSGNTLEQALASGAFLGQCLAELMGHYS